MKSLVTAETWRLLNLGGLDPLRAQSLYEAVALAVDRGHAPNTIILCYPAKPYVCLGFHQELEKEIDVKFCRKQKLPIIRRPVGGGAVYLDSGQQFYQIVVSEDSPLVPFAADKFFEKFLQATVHVYRALGVPAVYKPINDVVANGRKISGNGAGKIGDANVLVGNIIFDLNYDAMAQVLKVPDEKFRDKLAKSMQEWVSSLKRELGYTPTRDRINHLLIEGYQNIGIKLVPGVLSGKEKEIFVKEVKPKHLSKKWLYMPEFRHPELDKRRVVKVAENVRIVEASYKAKKMIRVTMEIAFDKIRDILISGDFFMIPEQALPKLEEALVGSSIDRGEILNTVKQFYDKIKVQTSGIKPVDFVEAIMKAVEVKRC
ncbi:MAG: lipoate--protein ligase [Candidatus Bathyarchaeota archaeon]|nr:lipoate--protein ligase [Candidatus Bathyarchaeota archaeon]